MKINIEAIRLLIEDKFHNRLSYFVAEIGVDYSYMNLIMNGHRAPNSKKVCEKIIEYCKRNDLDYRQYIIFF